MDVGKRHVVLLQTANGQLGAIRLDVQRMLGQLNSQLADCRGGSRCAILDRSLGLLHCPLRLDRQFELHHTRGTRPHRLARHVPCIHVKTISTPNAPIAIVPVHPSKGLELSIIEENIHATSRQCLYGSPKFGVAYVDVGVRLHSTSVRHGGVIINSGQHG